MASATRDFFSEGIRLTEIPFHRSHDISHFMISQNITSLLNNLPTKKKEIPRINKASKKMGFPHASVKVRL